MASNSIDSLNLQISANASSASKSLNILSQRLESLGSALNSVNTGRLSSLATGMDRLSSSLQGFKSNVKQSDFTKVAKGLRQIASVDFTGVINASGSINQLANSLSGIASLQFTGQGLVDIANSVSKLGRGTVTQAAANIPSLTTALTQLVNSLNTIGSVSFDTSGLLQLVSAISRLGGKTSTAAPANIDALATSLRNMMATLANAPAVNQNVIAMTNAMANLAKNSTRAGSATNVLSSGLKNTGKQARNAIKNTKSLASSIGKLYASYFLVFRAIRGIGSAIEKSMDFTEAVNYFEVAMDKIGKDAASSWSEYGYDSAEAYADSFSTRAKELTSKLTGFNIDSFGNATLTNEKNLGLDPERTLQYQAQYAQMADSIGMTEEAALNTSKALTMLGADWASLRNISFDSAWEKFASALAGQSRAVRALGIDITQTTLQQYAYGHGLTQSVMEMDQATKSQLRLLAILDQSQVAFGDLANTISSPANQLRLLTNNFSQLARIIGNLFMPIVSAVLPIINGLVIALQRLFSWIGALFGIEFSGFNTSIGGMDDSFADFTDEVGTATDSLGDANTAAKKLKNTILGFDELNVMDAPDTNSESGGGAGGGGGSGLGSPILDDAIADALAEYEEAWNKAFENMENKALEFADKIEAAFKRIWKAAEPAREAFELLWDEGLSKLGNFTWRSLESFYQNFLVPVGKWVLGEGLPDFFDITNEILNGINWGKLNKSVDGFWGILKDMSKITFKGLLGFYENFLAPVSKWTLNNAIPRLVDSLRDLTREINWNSLLKSLDNLWGGLSKFATGVGDGLIGFAESVMRLIPAITPILSNLANVMGGLLSAMPPSLLEAVGGALGGLVTAFLAFKGLDKIKDVIGNATSSGILGGIITFAKAHPTITLAAAALGGLVAVFQNALNDTPGYQLLKDMEAAADAAEEMRQAVHQSVEEGKQYVENYGEAEIAQASALTDEYFSLAEQTNQTTAEKERMKDIVEQLSDLIPNLNQYISEETGLLTAQKDTVYDLIEAQRQQLKQQAAEAQMSKHYEEIASAYETLRQNTDDLTKAEQEYQDALARRNALEVQWMNEDDYETARTLRDEIDKLDSQIYGFYIPAVQSARDAMQDTTGSIKESADAIKYYEESLFGASDIDYSSITGSAQSVIDALGGIFVDGKEIVGNEATDLYYKIIDQFDTLDEDMYRLADGTIVQFGNAFRDNSELVSEDIKALFYKLKEGMALSSEELGQLFLDIGYDLPQNIINGLSEKDAEVQNQFYLLFANAKTGASASSEELKLLFQNLGYYLPDSLIQTLSGKEGELQASTVQFLESLKNGEALSRDDLVSTFSALGIVIANDGIIDGLSKKSADVQNEAINLLGQIQVAADDQRQPLIEKFNNLAVGSVNQGLLNTLDGLTSDARNTAVDLISQIPLATDSEKPKIYEELENVGVYASKGLIEGLISMKGDVKDTSKEVAESSVEGAKEGFDEHSPSKKMEEVGSLAIQGLINGLNSKTRLVNSTMWGIANQIINYFNGLSSSFVQAGANMMRAFANGMQSVYIPMPHIDVSSYRQFPAGNGSFNIPNFRINWYANGGFPEDGLFFANHRELVGQFTNGRTAVANNQQIIEGIASGVAPAVYQAVKQAISESDSEGRPLYVEVKTQDDEVLARAVTRGQQKLERRMRP